MKARVLKLPCTISHIVDCKSVNVFLGHLTLSKFYPKKKKKKKYIPVRGREVEEFLRPVYPGTGPRDYHGNRILLSMEVHGASATWVMHGEHMYGGLATNGAKE